MRRPLVIELYAGTFGWSQHWLALGGQAVGFDIEHLPHHGAVPENAELVLQDVRTLDGAQFKDADLILASPPCQEFSYRAMPWKRAKALGPPLLGMELFASCFRIQREASAAAGHHIPMVVENVRGAQKYVGRAPWHFGSYYLWGDVPALMPITMRAQKVPRALKADGTKVGGFSWSDFGKEGYVAKGLNAEAAKRMNQNPVHEAVKVASESGRRNDVGKGARFTSRDCGVEREGVKHSAPGPRENGKGSAWFATGPASSGSKSSAKKAASALIARIPQPLSQHIADVYWPLREGPA